MIPQTLKIAMGELGIKEIKGRNHNPRVLEYHDQTSLNASNDETAWCSSFVNWVAQQAKLPRSNNAMARSWLTVGKATSSPRPGDVVVMSRGSSKIFGHVAFFIGYSSSGKSIYCIGGNQNNEVNITAYSKSKVLGYRRLSKNAHIEVPTGSLPVGYLRRGDNNANVKLLQSALIKLNFLLGKADGDFGPKTESALRKFQRTAKITVDGIYGGESRTALAGRL